MVRNFKLIIEYDGSGYHGWQRQKNDRTIQEEIEKSLTRMTNQEIRLIGSGRTDAGVHALGQTANFRCETRLTADVFLKGLNALLPDDIVIKHCEPVADEFHSRYDAKCKMYRYRILNRSIPCAIKRQYHWFVAGQLDIATMQKAADRLIGRHDFKAFEGAGSPRTHTIRNVTVARFESFGDRIDFNIEADGFLRYMVRNIVGTLVEVGLGKTSPEEFRRILISGNRDLAGPTAPAQGLFLVHVVY